jgi:hypothetical protein
MRLAAVAHRGSSIFRACFKEAERTPALPAQFGASVPVLPLN